MQKILLCTIAILVLFYGSACAYMYFKQRALVFPVDTRDIALDVALVPGASVKVLDTADGEKIKTWWVAPRNGDAPVYLYFQGNAETLAARDKRLTALSADGAGVLAVSWRGYGGSTGSPSETGLRIDALTAWHWLQAQVNSQRIIIFGESLGTGIALWLAGNQEAGALVLDSPYTSISAVAQQRFPWLPVKLLSRDPFDSIALAPLVKEPALAFQCREDPVVPYAMGVALSAALGSTDKHFETLPGRCHVPSIEPLLPLFRELEDKVQGQP